MYMIIGRTVDVVMSLTIRNEIYKIVSVVHSRNLSRTDAESPQFFDKSLISYFISVDSLHHVSSLFIFCFPRSMLHLRQWSGLQNWSDMCN